MKSAPPASAPSAPSPRRDPTRPGGIAALAARAVLLGAILVATGCRAASRSGGPGQHADDPSDAVSDAAVASASRVEGAAVPLNPPESPTEPDAAAAAPVDPLPPLVATDWGTQSRPVATAEGQPAQSAVIALVPGIRIDRVRSTVEIDAVVCIDAGWLEQIACSPQTREHESLVTIASRPRDVHAALLLLGLEPGAPGSWTFENDVLALVPPRGPRLSVEVRWIAADGTARREPIGRWVREARSGVELDSSWYFAGSVLEPARDGRSALYVADQSGSIIGLVTFGDEVIAFPAILPDQEGVAPLEYEAWTERLPPIGTPVTVLLTALDSRP